MTIKCIVPGIDLVNISVNESLNLTGFLSNGILTIQFLTGLKGYISDNCIFVRIFDNDKSSDLKKIGRF